MNILAFSLDQSVLDPQSKTAKRIARFGEFVQSYTLIVPSKSDVIVKLSPSVTVCGSGGGNKMLRLLSVYRLGTQLARETNRAGVRFDIVTVQDAYYLGFMARKIARHIGAALEVQIHGFEKYTGLRKIFARKNIRNADGVRVVSERLKKEILAEFGIDEGKITVVPVHTDISKEVVTMPVVSTKQIDRGGIFTFLTIARLVPVKNIPLQIEAFKEVQKKYPNTRLQIVGEGPLREHLEKIAARTKGVEFLGRRNDLAELYQKADAFILSSDREGWGLVIVEAAAYGLPIIMTDVGCAGEFIRNDEEGIIVPVGGRQELVEAMERLVSSPELCVRLGSAAKRAAQNMPSFEETMTRYVDGWKKLGTR